jgi:hypothetical protein
MCFRPRPMLLALMVGLLPFPARSEESRYVLIVAQNRS